MAQFQPVQTIPETFDTEVADQEDTVNLEAWFKSTERLARLGRVIYRSKPVSEHADKRSGFY